MSIKPGSFFRHVKISSLFIKYYISYIFLAVILLILVGSMLYRNFFTTLKNEIENTSMINLNQIEETMNTKLNEMEQIATQLSSNTELAPFNLDKGGYNHMEAVKELRKIQLANTFLYDIIVFHRKGNSGAFYAASGIYDMNTFFNYTYQYEDWGHENFMKLAGSLNRPVMRPVEPVNLDGKYPSRFATYLYPMFPSSDETSGIVMFLIEDRSFASLVKKILKSYNGYVYFLDRNNTPIYHLSVNDGEYNAAGAMEIFKNLDIESLKLRPIHSITINGTNFSAIVSTSENSKWSFITILPTRQFMEKVNISRDIFFKSLLYVLLLGFIIAFVLSSRNYKPISKLAAVLDKQNEAPGNPAGKEYDEISHIANTIDKITKQNQNLMYQVKNNKNFIVLQTLVNLLKGQYKTLEEAGRTLQNSEITFQWQSYVVMVFLIDNITDFEKENKKPIQEILKYGIVNVLEELASENSRRGYGIDMGSENSIVLLLNMANKTDFEAQMADIAYKAMNFFKNYYKFTMTVGMGNVYTNMLMISKSYEEAQTAANHRFMHGKEMVIFYKRLAVSTDNAKWYPFTEEQQLITLLKQGKISEPEHIISNIFQTMYDLNMSPDNARWVCHNLTGTINKAIDEMSLTLDERLSNLLNEIMLFNYETLWDFKQRIIEFCNDICSLTGSLKESKNFKLCDQIVEFIHQEYSDQNLSLKTIASQYTMSPSYLTRFFKDHMGISLMQYIDNLRMKKATMQLKSTTLSLSEIMDNTGYIDKTNFMRKFKKLYGTSPMQYRKHSGNAG